MIVVVSSIEKWHKQAILTANTIFWWTLQTIFFRLLRGINCIVHLKSTKSKCIHGDFLAQGLFFFPLGGGTDVEGVLI